MNYKYLNRIYHLDKIGVSLSNEENNILYKINSLRNFLENCVKFTSPYGNTFFYKDDIICVEHSMQLKKLFYNKKIGGIYNKEIILFLINDIFKLKTSEVISYNGEDSVLFSTFKSFYL